MANLKKFENKYGVKYHLNDSMLISFPKSGRTWVRMMLAKMLNDMGYDVKHHEMMMSVHYDVNKAMSTFTENSNILFMFRDPRDVVVSYYCEESLRRKRYAKRISEFIRDNNYGIEKVINYCNTWINNKSKFNQFKLITYEEMKSNTFDTMKSVTEYLNLNCGDKIIKDAVEYSKFENMKKIESGNGGTNYLKHYKGNFRENKSGGDSNRVRKGKIGGFVDYLDETDVTFVNDKLNNLDGELLCLVEK